ncbi:hypothetical protein M2302_006316 [Micromonospora sp. A200]|uniref:hypothetical protein n=1 Tax=Micromonospora sp. A200 TaxID=2940568 RepID=UPI002473C30D|nr:hypothetical protein [Micromonospora sp. A200]MDH6466110.1 hypothetical protein [Micromonospora sp. A200]
MTTAWVLLGAFGAVVASAVAWVAWRDRQRTASAEDPGARQAAVVEQQRHEQSRHVTQGDWIRGGGLGS